MRETITTTGLLAVLLSIATAGCRMFVDHGQVKPDLHAEVVRGADDPMFPSHWKGKRVAFLGDSITDPRHVGCTENYWNFLPRFLGIDAYVYGRNGWRMDGMLKQAEWLREDLGDEVDAIFVFAGTNDFNGSVPRGEWYNEEEVQTRRSQGQVSVKHRKIRMDETTFRGRINLLMSYLKHEFPRQQIVLMTILHRGYASFGPKNIQPDEMHANLLGEYVDAYNEDILQAGRIWSVPVLDVSMTSGLLPTDAEYSSYFHDAESDMLHPSSQGHRRLALTMAHWMRSLPSDFK